MSELNSTNAWPFTEISAEEGLDINAIFGDSTDTANQGNPFEAQAAAAAPAPAPATQEMPAAPAVEAAAPMPAVAPPKEAPAPAQPESNAAAGNPIAAAFEQKTAENTKKGLLEKPPVFYHKGVKEDIEDASMTFEELRIRKSEDFTDLEEGKRVSWSVEYCGRRPYLISCSSVSNSGVEKNSPRVISRPSQSFLIVTTPGFLLSSLRMLLMVACGTADKLANPFGVIFRAAHS